MSRGAFWGVIIAIIIILIILYFAFGKKSVEAPAGPTVETVPQQATTEGAPQTTTQPTTKGAPPSGGTTLSAPMTSTTLPGGLVVTDTVVGSGPNAALPHDVIAVQYTGTLENGTKFDSSYDHGGKPFAFELGAGNVIKGWDQGLVGVRAGGKRHLVIPAAMAYGAASPSPLIPPNSNLIFDVEVVEVLQALVNQKPQ